METNQCKYCQSIASYSINNICNNICIECNSQIEKMFAINQELYNLIEQGQHNSCHSSICDRSLYINNLRTESSKIWKTINSTRPTST